MAESGALVAAMPLLMSVRPVVPYPVLVVPGLSGGWTWCAPLRGYLGMLGYIVEQPLPGSTKGRLSTVRRRLNDRVQQLAQRHGQPIGVIGWSIGGCLCRQAAATHPESVRQLITLGTPLTGPWYRSHPEAKGSLEVASTAIYSRTDAANVWRECLQPAGERSENVEIISSHMGMATHPMAYYVMADRLAQPAGTWRPFRWSLPSSLRPPRHGAVVDPEPARDPR